MNSTKKKILISLATFGSAFVFLFLSFHSSSKKLNYPKASYEHMGSHSKNRATPKTKTKNGPLVDRVSYAGVGRQKVADTHFQKKSLITDRSELEEKKLMEELRRIQETNPARALELARRGNQHFPTSPLAAERAGRIVKSLALLGKFSEARGEAEKMVNEYTGTPWALEVERHTGAHPRYRRHQ